MTRLAPITTRRLVEFRRRRNTLLTARGLSAGLLVLIGMALCFMPIDAIWTIPDIARYIFATSIYVATTAVVFYFAIQPWLQGRSIVWLAGLFEKSDPRLENRLLAAVELSDEGSPDKRALDSAAFRESVQHDVAKILESVPVSRALPLRLIGRWLLLSLTLMLLVAVLCSFPSLHFSTRLSRILFPMANVGRVSQFAVSIRSPNPSSMTVPEEELITIVADVLSSGFKGSPKSVTMEVRSSDRTVERIAMRGAIGSELVANTESDGEIFQTNWSVPSGVTEYRVTADDSSTGWYQLRGVARPKIESFEIEYRYPSYTELDPYKLTSPSGNLEALEGTKALVSIRVNQPVASAVVRISPKQRGIRIKSLSENLDAQKKLAASTNQTGETRLDFQRIGGNDNLVAEIPISENGTYRIELTATATDFKNSFAPTYTIHTIQDRTPKIAWKNPREPSISVTPESIVEMTIQTEDELAIASLVQQIRKGTHEWEDQSNFVSQAKVETQSNSSDATSSTPVRGASVRQRLDTSFDLAMNRVQVGDTLQMRWVVTDKKGQSATSPILEMFVATASFDPSRRERMLDRIAVTKEVEKLKDVFAAETVTIKKAKEAFESDRDNPEKQAAVATSAKEFVANSKKSINDLDQVILKAMPKLKDSVSAEEFDRISQVVEKVRSEQLREVEVLSQQSMEGKSSRLGSEKIIDALKKANENITLASRRSKEFTGHDILSQIGQDLSAMLQYQKELKESVGSILPEQYRRKQALIARQFKELAEMTREQSTMLRDGANRQASQWAEWMDSQASAIHGLTGTDDRPKIAQDSENERKQLAERIEAELRNHQQASNIDGSLHDETRNGRNDLRDRSSKPSKLVEKLAEEIAKTASKPGDSPESVKVASDAMDSIERILVPALDQISHERATQQSRNDSDSQWIADLGDTFRAARAIAMQSTLDANEKSQKLKEVSKAMKKLEAVHELQQTARTVDEMQATERWKGLSSEAKFEQPRQLDAMKQRLERTVNSLREAEVSNEIVSKIDQMKWNDVANRIDQKIGPRRWSNERWVNAAEDLQLMQKSMREESKKLEEVAKEARMSLSELAPTVSDLAREASKSIDESVAPTELLAMSIGEGTVPDRNVRIDQLEDRLVQNDAPLQNLREALSDLASRQDLMKISSSKVARDADAASGITQQAEQRIAESLVKSREAKDDRDAQDAVQQSANTQKDASEALAMIAEHFDALSAADKAAALAGEPEDTNKLAGALAEAVSKMANSETFAPAKDLSLDPIHDEAERLRKLSSSNPERVLAQLEKELPRNPQMQQELSKIARNAVDDSLKTLEYSAKKEQTMSVEVENSDDEFREQKEQLRQAVQQSAEIASRISDTVLPRIRSTADRGQEPGVSSESERMRKELHNAADAARSASSDNSMESIASSAKSLGRSIEQARRELAQQSQKLEKASSSIIAADENQLKNRRREMEDWQRNYRNQDINHLQHLENQSKQLLQRAEQKLNENRQAYERRKKELDDAKRQSDEKPDDAGRKARVDQKNAELEVAQRRETKADAIRQEAEGRYEKAKKLRENQQSNQLDELNATNPHLQLGSKVATAAVEEVKIASEALREALAQAGQLSKSTPNSPNSQNDLDEAGPKGSRDKLKNIAEQQDTLKQGVTDASESIARAARHEARMKNDMVSETLMQQSEQIGKVASDQMTQAEESLSRASKESMSESSQANKMNASVESTVKSMQSLASSKQAIEKVASGLQSAFMAQTQNKSSASTNLRESSPSSQQSSGESSKTNDAKNNSSKNDDDKKSQRSLLSPQEMARMLDELDQQLAKSKGTAENSATAKASANGSGKGRSSEQSDEQSDSNASERAATLAEATRRLAASMNQQRRESESAKVQSSLAAARASDSRSTSRPGDSSDTIVLASDISKDGDWGRLREQGAVESAESVREGIAPAYRKQVEDYFKILSTRE